MASTWRSIIWTARPSNSGCRAFWLLATMGMLFVPTALAPACPFCTVLGPSLSQLRQQAAVTALAEIESQTPALDTQLRLHKVLDGGEALDGKQSLDTKLD